MGFDVAKVATIPQRRFTMTQLERERWSAAVARAVSAAKTWAALYLRFASAVGRKRGGVERFVSIPATKVAAAVFRGTYDWASMKRSVDGVVRYLRFCRARRTGELCAFDPERGFDSVINSGEVLLECLSALKV